MMESNPCDRISFFEFCKLLEKVQDTSKSKQKLKLILSSGFRKSLDGWSPYPVIRLILPHIDKKRMYNIKERKLGEFYWKNLGLGTHSTDAEKLLHWTDPNKVLKSNGATSTSVGNFGAVLEEVLQRRCTTTASKFTIGDINSTLDDLSKAEKNIHRKNIMMKILQSLSPKEQKWVVRIILKELKLGVSHETLLRYLHPDALEMFNHTNDLEKVCDDLRDAQVRYVAQIELFQIFTPMLAKRVELNVCTQMMRTLPFAIEPKLDGERVLFHMKGKQHMFFSRNGTDYTSLYGKVMTPYIVKQIKSEISCILDGEMLVWDGSLQSYLPFGMLKTVAKDQSDGINPHRWMVYIIWDIVSLEGKGTDAIIHASYPGSVAINGIMGLPLLSRRRLLETIVTTEDKRVELIQQHVVSTGSELEKHEIVMEKLDHYINNGEEGIILKDLSSHYICGENSRKLMRWIKLKPDHAGMTQDFDAIILGGYYGEGQRRSGDVSTFLLGILPCVLEQEKAEKEKNPLFLTFTKVGSGYNMEELSLIRNKLGPYWVDWDDNVIPSHFGNWKPRKSSDRPSKWIPIRNSMVLQIRAAELIVSDSFSSHLTTRFPRCERIRHDKAWWECSTLQDIEQVKYVNHKRNKKATDIQMSQMSQMSDGTNSRKKRKITSASRKPLSVLSHFSQPGTSNIKKVSQIFSGIEFCVLGNNFDITYSNHSLKTKSDVEMFIYSLGGTCVQNPSNNNTSCIIANSSKGLRVSNYIKHSKGDILHIQWLIECANTSSILPKKARHYVNCGDETRALLKKEYDIFGDHFTELLNSEELRYIFREMKCQNDEQVYHWRKKARNLPHEEQSAFYNKWAIFWRCIVYIDRHSLSLDPNSPDTYNYDILEQEIQLYGGVIKKEITETITHIISDIPLIKKVARQTTCPVVKKNWVRDSIQQGRELSIESYIHPHVET